MTTLRIKRLPHNTELSLPAYETAGSAGLDLRAAVPADAPITLAPRERALIPTGLMIALPANHEGQVRPRSGLAIKHGISLINTPGTIDEDYRGEVHVPLINHGSEPFVVNRGERIAQLVVVPVVQVSIAEVDDLDATERGASGFGSTGKA